MKKMLMVASVPSMIGQFNMNNINILQTMGYEVHVACNFKDKSSWNKERINDFVKQLKKLNIKKIQIDFSRTPFHKKNIAAYKQLKQLFYTEHFDLVHCHTPMGGLLGRICASKYRKDGTKVIYTAHGFHFYKGTPLKNWIIYYPVEKFCSFMTDVLITINNEDYALAQKKMKARRVEYIPGVGVDLSKFHSTTDVEMASDGYMLCGMKKCMLRESIGVPNEGFLMLSVGELSARKNHQVVIKALDELQNSDIYYCIAGIGNDKELYEQMIKEGHLEEKVILLGYRSDVSDLCQIADCFVHPSVREGLGIALLEAMACGLPLISSYINGIKDYTEDGISGCCIDEPLNVDKIKHAIIKMKVDPIFRERCGINNILTVQKFSLENSQRVMDEIYRKTFQEGY